MVADHIRAGKLWPLAVTTATRSERLPDIPTVDEFVPGYEASNWSGLGAPKNTNLTLLSFTVSVLELVGQPVDLVIDVLDLVGQRVDLAAGACDVARKGCGF
jgi:tripartite-type tricarboxylate transporter receptor subunit TctC